VNPTLVAIMALAQTQLLILFAHAEADGKERLVILRTATVIEQHVAMEELVKILGILMFAFALRTGRVQPVI
jgi:hypothetical protein